MRTRAHDVTYTYDDIANPDPRDLHPRLSPAAARTATEERRQLTKIQSYFIVVLARRCVVRSRVRTLSTLTVTCASC